MNIWNKDDGGGEKGEGNHLADNIDIFFAFDIKMIIPLVEKSPLAESASIYSLKQ